MQQIEFRNFAPPGAGSTTVNYSSQTEYDEILFCVKCNQTGRVEQRKFTYSHIPSYIFLILLLNIFIGLIVIALTSGQHHMELPFCKGCWNRYRSMSILAGLSLLVFIASIVGGVAMMLNLESGWMFFPLPVVSVALTAGLMYAKSRAMPRVVRSSKNEIVIDAGHYGLVGFSRAIVAKLHPTPQR